MKRVVAVAGDTIEMRDGQLRVNGVAQIESYAAPARLRRTFPKTTVPARRLFVMGDNRDQSQDSRSFGPIAVESVVGRPLIVLWSCKSLTANWLDANGRLRREFYWTALLHFYRGTRWNRTAALL